MSMFFPTSLYKAAVTSFFHSYPKPTKSSFYKSLNTTVTFFTRTSISFKKLLFFFFQIFVGADMGRFWTFLTYVHTGAGPVLMLLYPLYASVMALESPSKLDDEQWLAYWVLYSFLTLLEIVLQPILEWIPIWYTVKLAFVAWLTLPQFRGAAFIYQKFVREKILKKYGLGQHHSSNGKTKSKFVDFVTLKKSDH